MLPDAAKDIHVEVPLPSWIAILSALGLPPTADCPEILHAIEAARHAR